MSDLTPGQTHYRRYKDYYHKYEHTLRVNKYRSPYPTPELPSVDEKKCSVCHLIKPLEEFYVQRTKRDWRGCACKDCSYQQGKKYRQNRAKWNKTHKESVAVAANRYNRKYPVKTRARNLLHKAVKEGVVSKKPCEVCGKERAHAHHPDWNKPLDVLWLCPQHHKDAHFGRLSQ